jgi:hypothetical protein
MSRGSILTLAVIVLVAGLIALSMRGVQQIECEVCITFNGEKACAKGAGRTQEDAQRTAAEACCAVLPTSGMAERIKCADSEPTSLSCN